MELGTEVEQVEEDWNRRTDFFGKALGSTPLQPLDASEDIQIEAAHRYATSC